MNALFPFIAAVLQATSSTIDKVVLSMRRVDYRTYAGISFPLYFLAIVVIFFIFQPPLSADLFTVKSSILIFLSSFLIVGMNLVYYRALDADSLGEMQTIDLLWNVPLILYASLIFIDERNYSIIILSLIASLSIIWSHWEHHHFRIKKYTSVFLFWTLFLVPFHAIIVKELLRTWHPISLQFVVQTISVIAISILTVRHIKSVSIKAFSLLALLNILSAIAYILYYFSFQLFGIVYTTLLFSLKPLLVYFASLLFLKEALHWKKIVAFMIVLISIVAAQII